MTEATQGRAGDDVVQALKPCPFCDSDTVQTVEFRWNPVHTMWAVECVRGCEARGPVHDDEAGAMLLWNTRTSSTAPLVEALRAIRDGDVPRPIGAVYRSDGVESKHDRCVHGEWMYSDCAACIADFASAALSQAHEGQGK